MAARDILSKDENDAVVGKIAGNKDIKSAVESILKKREDLDNLRADVRALYDAAADKGIDRKALKAVVEFKRGQMASEEHKSDVNRYLEALGELPLFAVAALH